jgi:hypothetical protein
MNLARLGLAALSLLWIASTSAAAAPAHSIAPLSEHNRMAAQQTCHHVRQTSRRYCTSTRLLQQAIRPPLHYPRRYFGTRHYNYPFAYYGYRPEYYPYYYRPYWYRSPFWY